MLFAEALTRVGGRPEQQTTALIETGLAVMLLLGLARDLRRAAISLAAAVPLSLVGFVAFWLGGFRQ